MAKQSKLTVLAFVFALVVVAGFFFSPAGSAQRPAGTEPGAVARPAGRTQQKPAETRSAARNAALVAATQAVLKETSEIRQLPILRPVPSSAQSRSEIEGMIIKNLDADTTPAQIHADEVTLRKLGLVPSGFQYRPFMIRLLTEQVAGYYDPKRGEFHLADWIDLDGQRPVMAHELTHALQDQHFDLRRFEHWPKGDSDAELAVHALIEGDATLAMSLYVANDPMRALAFLRSLGATGVASAELEKAPRALRETLLFPYQQGTAWTTSLYKRDGWDPISKAFTELPQSTEQILHPDKYLKREAPVKVTLPDITNLLNAGSANTAPAAKPSSTQAPTSAPARPQPSRRKRPIWSAATRRRFDFAPNASALAVALPTHRSLPTAAWRRIDYDVQGEWGFYLILDQFLKSPAESRRAAAGWGGDRFAVYEGPGGETCIVSLSAWDTENDAREFFEAYVKRISRRYPSSRADLSQDEEPLPPSQTPRARLAWRSGEGIVLLERRGNRVLILEGVPTETRLGPLMDTFW